MHLHKCQCGNLCHSRVSSLVAPTAFPNLGTFWVRISVGLVVGVTDLWLPWLRTAASGSCRLKSAAAIDAEDVPVGHHADESQAEERQSLLRKP